MPNSRKTPCENLYLNSSEADVWFVCDGDRIPGHKLILTSVSPWFRTMFCGSLPEQGDVDMTANASAAEFKEFLQFFYLYDVKLTQQNIEGVLNLVKQSMVEEFFFTCENFLIETLTIETMCWGYQLAIIFDANQLQLFCERAISINATEILKSQSFLSASYEIVHRILKLDTLLCSEKQVFSACIAWAQASCERNGQDPSNVDNLRCQLKDLLHQVRFVSVSDEEFGTLLHKFSDLFSKEETQEIVFIRSRVKDFRPKWFNSKSRLFQQNLDECDLLTCKRFIEFETGVESSALKIKRLESVILSSNRPVLLRGFLYGTRFGNIRIKLIEKCDDENILPLFERCRQVDYDSESTADGATARAKFHMPIVIEPNVKYEIQLELENVSGYKRSLLLQEVNVGQGITIQFHPSDGESDASRSVLQLLYFSSLDKWPTKLFLRARQSKPFSMKGILKSTGHLILKFLDFLVFFTSLIM